MSPIPNEQFSFKQQTVMHLSGEEIMSISDDPNELMPFMICDRLCLTKRQAAAIAAGIIRVMMHEGGKVGPMYHEFAAVSDVLIDLAITH